MDKSIAVLIIEDFEADAELLCRELRKSNIGFSANRVQSKDELINALRSAKPDLILSDYSFPAFNGSEVLAVARERCPDVPLIFVSGSMGEALAVEALKAGASDYVTKDQLSKLGPAVQRALREAEELKRARSLEEQLRQTQKMEVVGRLAGGIAHDFNNILTAISGYSELLISNLSANDPNRADAEEIKKTVYRAAALTRQLLSFSRKQSLRPVVLDLNAVVANIEKMLKRVIGEDVKLTTKLDPTLSRVLADEGQIEQVIMNLAVNSRDAMPGGGQLMIETKNVELDGNYAAERIDVKPGRYTMVSVSDTGCGISPEIREKIFEPFFTTKEKGTGLGLSTVYGIAKQFGGHVAVYSEIGKGTSFKVYLPPVDGALNAIGEKPVALAQLKGSETILFVDDEDAIRRLAERVLNSNGYKVIPARNGEEALRFAESHGPVHVLVTDLVMFGINGYDLASSMVEKHPDTKVIYLSGYTDEMIKHHVALDGAVRTFLPKPFSPNDLLRKVREILGS